MRSAADDMFLGEELRSTAFKIRSRHKDAFKLAEEINTYANWKLQDTTAKRSNRQQVLMAALLPRLLTAFQGCVLLAERGLRVEAMILARKVLDGTFRIVAIGRADETAKRYIESDEISRRDVLKKLQSLSTVKHDSTTTADIQNRHKEVDARVRSEGIRSTSSKDYAELAGMLDYYNTAYAYFSQSAHANLRELEDVIETDDDNDPVAVKYGPSDEDISLVLNTASEAVVISLGAVFDLFAGQPPVGLRVLQRKVATALEAQAK